MLPLKRRLARLLDRGILALEVPSCLVAERFGASTGTPSFIIVWCELVGPCGPNCDPEGAVVETADGTSDPATEALELGIPPPALAELNEYREDVDIRLMSAFVADAVLRIPGSGKGVFFVLSDMIAAANFGVSESSIADSSIEAVVPSVQACEASEAVLLRLVIEEACDVADKRPDSLGNEKLTLSA